MANNIIYKVELIPENAELIDKLNSLLIPGYTAQGGSTSTKETPKKEPSTEKTSLAALKTACKAAKKEHGEDFVNKVIEDAGVELKPTLGKTVSAIPVEKYVNIMTTWATGPAEEDDGLGDDDDLGGDDPEVTADAVKTALKAYAKSTGRDEAKKIMTDNGAKSLSAVDDCDAEQLAAMMKALV